MTSDSSTTTTTTTSTDSSSSSTDSTSVTATDSSADSAAQTAASGAESRSETQQPFVSRTAEMVTDDETAEGDALEAMSLEGSNEVEVEVEVETLAGERGRAAERADLASDETTDDEHVADPEFDVTDDTTSDAEAEPTSETDPETSEQDEPGVETPETPVNDPDWDKTDPDDRIRIRDQVATIRAQVQGPFEKHAAESWKEVQDNWTDGEQLLAKYNNAIEREGKPEHLFKGIEAHRRFENKLNAEADQLVDPESGYELRTEVSYNAQGLEVPRGTKDSLRPDVVLLRNTVDDAGEESMEPVHVWDYKTGKDEIRPGWARELEDRIDPLFTPETINPDLQPPPSVRPRD